MQLNTQICIVIDGLEGRQPGKFFSFSRGEELQNRILSFFVYNCVVIFLQENNKNFLVMVKKSVVGLRALNKKKMVWNPFYQLGAKK